MRGAYVWIVRRRRTASLFTSVLLVSHDPENLSGWAHSLSDCSPYYNILKASTEQDAIGLLRVKPLDCVVVDLDIPDIGYTILQRIIHNRHRTPLAVVALTEAVSEDFHEIASSNGADVCVGKALLGPRSLDRIVREAVSGVRKNTHSFGEFKTIRGIVNF